MFFSYFLESRYSAFRHQQSHPALQILALILRAVGFPLRPGLAYRVGITIEGFSDRWNRTLLNKPDRAGSPHPDFSSGEDYKRWRDYSTNEKQNVGFQKKINIRVIT
jgi:hypothetical protein